MNRAITITAFILLLLNGISAVYGGINFMLYPDGNTMGMSVSHLRHSPFSSYFIPGTVLFVVNGLLSLVIACLVLVRVKHYALTIVLQGIMLLGWLLIQIIILRFVFILHLVMAIVAVLLIATGTYLHIKKQAA